MSASIRPTRRALALAGGAIALFAVGTNVQAGWVLAIAALLLGILVTGVILPLRALSGLDIARRVPRTANAGRPVTVTLAVTNSSRRVRGLVGISDDFCGPGAAVVTMIGPGETREYLGERDRTRRGVHAIGTCKLETGFPFGVMLVRRTHVVESPIVVYPTVYEVGPRRNLGASESRTSSPYGDVSSVRDYHRGDPLRHVHWRSVARRGQLVVREFDNETRSEVMVAAEVPADSDLADAIATVACSLALGAMRDGSGVTVWSSDGDRLRPAQGPDDVLDWGARLVANGLPFGPAIRRADAMSSLICVCPARTSAVDALCELASGTSVFVVLVGGQKAAADVARLRGAGATVASVRTEEIQSWLATAYAAS
jgi:uncharacterized protein (DUF58 family)